MNTGNRINKKRKGQTMVEYGIIIALVVMVIIGQLTNVGGKIKLIFGNVYAYVAGNSQKSGTLGGVYVEGHTGAVKFVNGAAVTPTSGDDYIGQTPPKRVNFNGTSTYATIPDNGQYTFGTGDFTAMVAFNVKYYPAGGQAAQIFRRVTPEDSSGGNIELQVNSAGSLDMFIGGSSYSAFGSNIPVQIDTNKQYTAAIVRQSGTVKVYLNGVLAFTGSGYGPVNQSGYISLGRDSTYGTEYFNGNVLSFSLWSKALSAAETAYYTTNAATGNETGLKGAWSFIDSSSNPDNIVSDISPYHNSATVTNGTWVLPQ